MIVCLKSINALRGQCFMKLISYVFKQYLSSKFSADHLFLKELCPLNKLVILNIATLELSYGQFLSEFYDTYIVGLYKQFLGRNQK